MRLTVIEELKIIKAQIAHGVASAVTHDDGYGDQVGGCFKGQGCFFEVTSAPGEGAGDWDQTTIPVNATRKGREVARVPEI